MRDTGSKSLVQSFNKQRLGLFRSALISLAALSVIGPLVSTPAFADSITLAWDGSSGAAGYKLYYGITPGPPYSASVDIGNVTTYLLSGLDSNTLYYFAVTAYSSSGEETTFSNEVSSAHPADTSGNMRIEVVEYTSYVAAWKSGATWSRRPQIPYHFSTLPTHWESGSVERYTIMMRRRHHRG